MEIIEAIEKLKDNHALICLENRALIKMEKEKAKYISAKICFPRFSPTKPPERYAYVILLYY